MSDPLVTIIIRSFNEGWALRETLPALRAQDFKRWQLIVVDSGSTDGSVALIRQARATEFIQIEPWEYHPSRVMNHAMRLARSDFAIFLNADATPQGSGWLRPLVSTLADPRTAAVFGRQIPRPACRAVYACDYERCFGANRESAKWDHFFSMVSSGLRRDVWARRGFLETMRYSEDDEYTRWCRAQGYQIEYVPGSVVMHSHNYTPSQAYERSRGEGRALAAVWPGGPRNFTLIQTVFFGWLNDFQRDLVFCARARRPLELFHAMRIRWRQRCGKLKGFKEGWAAHRANAGTGGINPPSWART